MDIGGLSVTGNMKNWMATKILATFYLAFFFKLVNLEIPNRRRSVHLLLQGLIESVSIILGQIYFSL